jgi:hypothetical protein
MPAEYTALDAYVSPDGVYRYRLSRTWADGKRCAFVMLNPSTADGMKDDPTIRRCTGFAQTLGFGGYTVVNLFALRATDPAVMLAQPDAVGPENHKFLAIAMVAADRVFAAWGGTHKRVIAQAEAVRALAQKTGVPLDALKLSKNGTPCHPLYLPGDLTPVRYFTPEEPTRE